MSDVNVAARINRIREQFQQVNQAAAVPETGNTQSETKSLALFDNFANFPTDFHNFDQFNQFDNFDNFQDS